MLNSLYYVLTALFLIAFEMGPEGLVLRGYKKLAGSLEFVYRAAVTLVVFAWLGGVYSPHIYTPAPFLATIGGFLLVRFALADLIYNLCAKLPILYIGTTKYYDRIWGWFFRWSGINREHFLAMFKFIALCIGVSLLAGRPW